MRQPEKKRLVASHQVTWTNLWTWLGFLAAFFVGQAALLWVMQHGPWWSGIPLILLLAHLMHAHLLALHDAAHGTLCPHRGLNDAIGVFIGSLGLIEFSLFRVVHHMHHSYLGTERDEELWPFVHPEVSRGRRRLAAVLELGAGLFYTPCLLLRALLRRGSTISHAAVRRRIKAELALMLAVWIAILAATLCLKLWSYLLVLYALPAWLAGNFQSWRKYVEHMGLTGARTLECTRTIVPQTLLGRFLVFTLFHEPYHGVHHKFPCLPHGVLPEMSSILEPPAAAEIPPFPNYRRAVLDMLGSLSDPRIGAQWRRPAPALTGAAHLFGAATAAR